MRPRKGDNEKERERERGHEDFDFIVNVSPLQAMKAHGRCGSKIHLHTATALGRGRVASPMLGLLYPWVKPPVLILQEAERTPGSIWTRKSNKKPSLLRHPESSPGHPAHSQSP